MKLAVSIASVTLAGLVAGVSGQTILANPASNNGGSSGWGMFMDLQASASGIAWTEFTTASNAQAGASYTVDIWTRSGSALGGPVGVGAGSSAAGWTLHANVNATQGGVASGISLPILLPALALPQGETVGIALIFSGAGPRYFGTGTPPYGVFSDANLQLTTGDARTQPFMTSGSFFSSRALVGSITYVPSPAAAALLGFGGLAAARRRR